MLRTLIQRGYRECKSLALLAILVLSAVWAVNAQAQSPNDINAASRNAERIQQEEQQRQQQQFLIDQESKNPPTHLERPVAPTVTPQKSETCAHIQEIRIHSAPHLSQSARADIMKNFVERCLNVNDLQTILATITSDYVRQGYIAARAYVRQQDAAQGVLEILVVEGSVEKIQIEDDGQHSVSVTNVFPGIQGRALNLRDFEQGLDQINRLASNNASMSIEPGTQAGDSVVVIRNAPTKTWHVTLSGDNQGGESTGRNQVGVSVQLDNPLGLNDFFSITNRRSIPLNQDRQASLSNTISYIVPYGYNTFSLGLAQSDYVSTLVSSGGQFLRSNGNSSTSFIKAERVVYRDQIRRANLSTTLNLKDANNYLAGQFLSVSSRKLAVWDIDVNYSTQVLNGIGSAELGYSRGLDRFGALSDPNGLPDSAPRAQFRKVRYGASYFLPFKLADQRLTFSSQLSGQYGIDALYSSEQILIGGIYSVRGFVNTTFSGDNGFTVRNEVSTQVPFSWGDTWPAALRVYAALDYGRVFEREPNTGGGYLMGAAIGCSVNVGSVLIDVFNSRPLNFSSGAVCESPRTYLQLRINI